MKVLEEDVEKSLQREESRLDVEEQSYPEDVQKVVQELKSKHSVSRPPTKFDTLLTMERMPGRGRATTKTRERDRNEEREGGSWRTLLDLPQ